jgi:hypothetical protein
VAETSSIEVAAMWFGFPGDFAENFHGRIARTRSGRNTVARSQNVV